LKTPNGMKFFAKIPEWQNSNFTIFPYKHFRYRISQLLQIIYPSIRLKTNKDHENHDPLNVNELHFSTAQPSFNVSLNPHTGTARLFQSLPQLTQSRDASRCADGARGSRRRAAVRHAARMCQRFKT
jgi:hypothetical protein